MHILLSIIVSLAGVIFSVGAFVIPQKHTAFPSVSLDMAGVGIFYGTSTGSTEDVADRIKDAFGDDADGPFDVDALEGSVTDNFEKYDAIICGKKENIPSRNDNHHRLRLTTKTIFFHRNSNLEYRCGYRTIWDWMG
jgi:hypothetical protein